MPAAKTLSIGAPNPRALAEIVLRRRVDWKRVSDPNGLVAHALGVKYSELFDPKYKTSPLYIGLREVPEEVRDAALGMGMGATQSLLPGRSRFAQASQRWKFSAHGSAAQARSRSFSG